jgi:hypothetical protein
VIQNLNFGSMVADRTGGSLSLTFDRLLIPLGSGIRPGGSVPCQEGRFLLSGPPNTPFQIRLVPVNPVLTNPRGGSLIIEEFYPSLAGFQGVFDFKGQAELRLGARLDIRGETQPGLYQSTQVVLQLVVADPKGPKTVSYPFTIAAQLLPDLCLTNTAVLEFGGLMAGQVQGAFQVSPDGSYRSLGGNGPVLLKGTPHPARFTLRGQAETSYHIQLPDSAVLTGPGRQILIKDFTCSAQDGRLPLGGLEFTVGGSLIVPPGQASGSYRGEFYVFACYQ